MDNDSIFETISSATGTFSVSGFTNIAIINRIGTPVYDDPIKKIKIEMGYKDVEPDRWEHPLFDTGFTSTQPMTITSGTVFHCDYTFKPITLYSITGIAGIV